ncbi:MAG: DUF4143 domain-containing protein [Thermodesulfobacteriota bacterium]|nr:DUF4143 domain-containing protein [Thermodesulfobacteriota bacterium]
MEDIPAYAMKGTFFKTLLLSEFYKAFAHRGEITPLYFWRDQTGHEVDVVIETGEKFVPVKIKSGETVAGFF